MYGNYLEKHYSPARTGEGYSVDESQEFMDMSAAIREKVESTIVFKKRRLNSISPSVDKLNKYLEGELNFEDVALNMLVLVTKPGVLPIRDRRVMIVALYKYMLEIGDITK